VDAPVALIRTPDESTRIAAGLPSQFYGERQERILMLFEEFALLHGLLGLLMPQPVVLSLRLLFNRGLFIRGKPGRYITASIFMPGGPSVNSFPKQNTSLSIDSPRA
jgi:hypothetical protein